MDQETFFITGASRGIGLELATQLVGQGQKIIALVRKPAASAALEALAKRSEGRLRMMQADVCVDADLERVARELKGEPLDVLINNAGVLLGYDKSLEALSLEQVRETLEVNTIAPMRVARALLSNLAKGKNPRLVNMTSLMGSIADNTSGGAYAYRMSKAALNMFTKTFAIDHPKITAIVMHPGWVQTEMGGPQAPTPVKESAAGILKTIAGLRTADTGKFFQFQGKLMPW